MFQQRTRERGYHAKQTSYEQIAVCLFVMKNRLTEVANVSAANKEKGVTIIFVEMF